MTVDAHGTGGALNVSASPVEVALLTGGIDKPYVFGLSLALTSTGVQLELVGSDEVDSPELHAHPNLKFLNFRGDQRPDVSLATKMWRISVYYTRLIRYTRSEAPKLFHVLWNNRFQMFDRTALMLYYKLRGRKVLLTAHNVNGAKRDSNDSVVNRLTLKIQYRLADHIFVHTEQMKGELLDTFSVCNEKVTVIPFGINNAVPHTDLTPVDAKHHLGLVNRSRTILFFGRIGSYKGLDCLVTAFQAVATKNPEYHLLIAGQPKQGSERYWEDVQGGINRHLSRDRVITKIEYIPDEDTEVYFKAADVLVLPYTNIYQSGVLFLAHSFGLPVIASDIGSFREDVIPGETGFLFRPGDAESLADTINAYFESDLFKHLDDHREKIRQRAGAAHSWDVVGRMTHQVYLRLLEETA